MGHTSLLWFDIYTIVLIMLNLRAGMKFHLTKIAGMIYAGRIMWILIIFVISYVI